jgi:hypothetical protein
VGGVSGAAVAKLVAFKRLDPLSSCGGEKGSIRWGGCGNRDSEKVDGVGVVCALLERERSVEKLKAAGGGERQVEFTFAGGEGNSTGPVAAGGFGNLFLGLKYRTLLDEFTVDMLDMLPACTRGSADRDRKESSSSVCCCKFGWVDLS